MRLPGVRSYPKEIRLGDETYSLRFVRRFKDKDTMGECDPSEKCISIRLGMSREDTFRTVLHEILHVIEFEHPVDLKHSVIYKLEEALFKLLLDNF